MKLIILNVRMIDYEHVIKYLNTMPLNYLKISQTNGVICEGNVTLFIKVNNDLLDEVVKNISLICKRRSVLENKREVLTLNNYLKRSRMLGGANLYIIDLENFIKV